MGQQALVELKSGAIVDGWCRRVAKDLGSQHSKHIMVEDSRVDDPGALELGKT